MAQVSEGKVPRYVLVEEESAAIDALAASLEDEGSPLERVESVDELLGADGSPRPPGWVFLPPRTGPDVLADLLIRAAAEPGAWSPILLLEDDDGFGAVPLAPGHREQLDELLRRVNGNGPSAGGASFRICLEELSRIRHDLNNPLTAALAEVQLVRMDIDPGSEVEGALETIEGQLRRIRDMIAELTVLRPPQR